MEGRDAAVIGVIGASGGVGASTFSAALSATAASGTGRAVLLDLDDRAGGIDVLLGAEEVEGPRWSGLRLSGGYLDPQTLAAALPRWGPVAFVSADVAPTASVVDQTVAVAAQLATVVIDLPRWPSAAGEAARSRCDLIVVVAGSYVAQITAARALALGLGGQPAGVVVRTASAGSGRAVAELIGLPLVGTLAGRLRRARGDLPLNPHGLGRPLLRTARGVLDALEFGVGDA